MYKVFSAGYGYIAELNSFETLEGAVRFCKDLGGMTIDKINELGINVIEIRKENKQGELLLTLMMSERHIAFNKRK